VMLCTAHLPRRRKLLSAGLVIGILLATYGGVQAATHASPRLAERTRGILHPLEDKSVKLRFDNWGRLMRSVEHHPLGHGVGAAGAASATPSASVLGGRKYVTADNTFIKVLYDQGVLFGALFIVGILTVLALLARRLARADRGDAALGLAALAGFVAFLGLSATGEYVEQPGKVIAWALLGVAAAQAFPREGERGSGA
jgi:O-antigen ligase